MAVTLLTFANPINDSLQVGDTVYYCAAPSTVGGFETNSSMNDIIKLGAVLSIESNTTIHVTIEGNTLMPDANAFVFFSKDNAVNLSSIIGYYASVKMTNDSVEPAEIFSVGLGVVESSK